jgi:hypothetical protein
MSDDTETIIKRGETALDAIETGAATTFRHWLEVGEALEAGQALMMGKLGCSKPSGKRWSEGFGLWLKEHRFDRINKGTRSILLKIMGTRQGEGGNLPSVETWYASLPVHERIIWNHPQTVWSKYNAKFGLAGHVKKSALTPMQQLQNANIELQDKLDSALVEISRLNSGNTDPHIRPDPDAEAFEPTPEIQWDSDPDETAAQIVEQNPDKAKALMLSLCRLDAKSSLKLIDEESERVGLLSSNGTVTLLARPKETAKSIVRYSAETAKALMLALRQSLEPERKEVPPEPDIEALDRQVGRNVLDVYREYVRKQTNDPIFSDGRIEEFLDWASSIPIPKKNAVENAATAEPEPEPAGEPTPKKALTFGNPKLLDAQQRIFERELERSKAPRSILGGTVMKSKSGQYYEIGQKGRGSKPWGVRRWDNGEWVKFDGGRFKTRTQAMDWIMEVAD